MARPIRVEFPGAVYHVTARGNEGRRTFRDDGDRERFLETLGQAAGQHGLLVHAYCLMPNHCHLLVETPLGNLSGGSTRRGTMATVTKVQSLRSSSGCKQPRKATGRCARVWRPCEPNASPKCEVSRVDPEDTY